MGECDRLIPTRPHRPLLSTFTAGILQYISIQFEILTNQEAPITGIHCKMPTVFPMDRYSSTKRWLTRIFRCGFSSDSSPL